ncbi:MAG: sulfotransferase [Planctomycetaceae bacterium]|nr:sulfotransferase [Planctomycetaceae bacterium]
MPFDTLLPQALELHRAGQLDHADQLYGQLTSDLPKLAQVVHLRGIVAHSKGQFDLTIQFASQAAALDPSNTEYHNLLGSGYYHAGRYEEAIVAFQQAILTQPTNALAHANAALALQAAGRFHESLATALKAVELRPDLRGLRGTVGISLVRLGRHREAIHHFLAALEVDPKHVLNWMNLGHLYKELGEFELSRQAYQRVLALAPNDGDAILGLALIRKHTREDLGWCVQLEQLLLRPQLTVNDRYSIHFALGKIYEDIGHYAVAFSHFQKAHAVTAHPYDRSTCVQRFQSQRDFFTPEWFANRRGFGNESTAPIFIVGMFRSGSTLVEQTLASHSLVHGAGELPDMERLYGELPKITGGREFPRCLDALTATQTLGLANDYLNRRRVEMGDKPAFTDKMLVNFWNLGLIALLFPRAKIIHCLRDPLDTCVSCYMNRFTDRPDYAQTLSDLGFYYQHYVAMMNLWRRVLPLPILDVAYEDMVLDQTGTTRRVLEFCELPWEESCLHFHESGRPISTSSDWQIRQPLYKSALSRSQRYAPYLGELHEALKTTVG